MAKQYQGKKNMDTVLYTGTGAEQSIGGLDFSPDLVWIKGRSNPRNHQLFDTVRGAGNLLVSDNANTEDTGRTDKLSAFTSDGFVIQDESQVNYTGDTYAAWCWNAGEETQVLTPGALNSETYNQDEVWSSLGSVSSSGTAAANYTALFDGSAPGVGETLSGNGSNGWRIGGIQTDVGSETVSGLNIPFTSSVKIRYTKVIYSGNNNNAPFLINGVDVLDSSNTDDTVREMEVSDFITSPITSLEIARTAGGDNNLLIYQISIDGKILADTGATLSPVPSIETTVRANPEAGFSVATYSGDNSVGGFGHGLSSPPVFAFIKSRTNANGWAVYHKSLAQGNNLTLNSDNTYDTYGMFPTAPTDQVFNVSNNTWVNGSGNDYVAYCWSEIPGYSKAGKYTGNGTTSNFVYTGFKPQWILVKRNATSSWVLWDNTRPDTAYLKPDSSGAEAEGLKVNALSNGFEIANSNGQYNGSGGTYYFMAFAEKPMYRPKRVELEFQDTQDFREILEGDTLTEYTLAGPGESATVESKDVASNKIIALADDVSAFTTDNTRSMTKPVTDPSNKRWTWAAWVKRGRLDSQTILSAGDLNYGFIFGFDSAGRLEVNRNGWGNTRFITKTKYTDTSIWMHVTLTLDMISGDGFRLYVNGEEYTDWDMYVAPPAGSSSPLNATGTEQIIGNNYFNDSDFSGYLADIQFYDGQALTPSDLVYNNPSRENQLHPGAPQKWFGTRGYHLDFGDSRSTDLFSQDVSGNDDNWSSSNVQVLGHSELVTAPITKTVDDIIPTQYTITWDATFGQPLSPATQRPPAGQYRVINLDVTEFNIANVGGYGQLGWNSQNTFNTTQYNSDTCGIYLNSNNGNAVYLNPGGPTSIGPAGFTHGSSLYKVKDPSGPTGERGFALTNDGSNLTGTIQFIFDGYGNVWLMFNGDYMYANGTTTFDPTSDVMDYTKGVDGFPLWTGFPDGQVFGLNTQTTGNCRYVIDTNGFLAGSDLTFSNSTNLEVVAEGDTVTQGDITATVKSSDVRNKTLVVNKSGFAVNSTVTLNSNLRSGDMDSVTDTPNNYGVDDGLGGEQRGSYGTWNPHDIRDIGSQPTQMWNGNLSWGDRGQSNAYGSIIGNFPMGAGKWYWELTLGAGGSGADSTTYFGIVPLQDVQEYWQGNIFSAYIDAYSIRAGTRAWTGSGDEQTGYLSGTPAEGTVYSFALDTDTGNLEVWMDGVSGGNFPFTIPAGKTWVPFVSDWSNSTTVNEFTANFGATPFKYPAPVGYKTLNTTNLEDGLVVQGNTAMSTTLYTGNGGTQTISGLNFSPDLVWIKSRSQTSSHSLSDTVRGVGKVLFAEDSDREYNQTPISSFNSDGFTVTNDATVNSTGDDFVAWCWDAGDSAPALNTTGSIASTVKANPTTGFSITTYTGTGAAASIGHGLGVAPKFVLVKSRSDAYEWKVYHSSLGDGQYLVLNSNSAKVDDSSGITWNNLDPTSSVIHLGSGVGTTNSGSNFVVYSWSEVPGYSQFGNYTGNGSATSGPFIHTGFEVAWVMIKRTDSTDHWYMYDNKRDGSQYNQLTADIGDAEYSATDYPSIDVHANGFQITGTNAGRNASGGKYVYAAFAELPQQYMPQ